MSTSAIEATLLRHDLLKSDLDPKVVDMLAPTLFQMKYDGSQSQQAFKLNNSVIPEGKSSNWIARAPNQSLHYQGSTSHLERKYFERLDALRDEIAG